MKQADFHFPVIEIFKITRISLKLQQSKPTRGKVKKKT